MRQYSNLSRRHVVAGSAGLLLAGFCAEVANAAPETFSIFFAKDSTDLSPTALEIVAAIKTFIKPNTRTTIVGHCDTSESDPDKLSLARANAVQAALMKLSLPAGATVTASGVGAKEPRRPTGPNVPEPLNRFVSIIVQ